MLSVKHMHERDKGIQFKEQGHIYNVKGSTNYTSVTTWVKQKFEKFDADKIIDTMMASSKWEQSKYYNQTKQEIKDLWKANGSSAAKEGTDMHKMCEDYYNGKTIDRNTTEHRYFLEFVKDHSDLVPYRTEWMIYDEKQKIAGSIDMVSLNRDGTLSIYDWKRCKSIEKHNSFNKFSIDPSFSHIPDTNFWHYTLQLNMYKTILENNYGFTVSDMYLVCIHPELHTTYKKLIVPKL